MKSAFTPKTRFTNNSSDLHDCFAVEPDKNPSRREPLAWTFSPPSKFALGERQQPAPHDLN